LKSLEAAILDELRKETGQPELGLGDIRGWCSHGGSVTVPVDCTLVNLRSLNVFAVVRNSALQKVKGPK